MEVTLVKNPAKRSRSAKKSSKKASSAKRSVAAKKAWATRRRNASAAARKTRSNPTKRKASSKSRTAAKRSAAAKKAWATRRRNAKSATRKKTARKNPSRKNPDVAQRLPVVGKSKTAKWFDGEMKMNAHGAQKWGSQKLTQKAVTSLGAFSGYGYGGTFAQLGQGVSENALLGSGAGIVSGLAGVTLSSYAVNKVMGEMLLKGHEKKHHTFGNFTKGWRVGGYVGVGLNTITNLLTMHYGRSYGNLGSWSNLVNDMKGGNMMHTVKKMVAKSAGAHKLAHVPAVASLLMGQGMYNDGPEGPLQGFAFGQDMATTTQGAAAHPADVYTDDNGYYGDNNDQLGYVDVMGDNRHSTDIGYIDVLGYPSGVGYPAEFAENQPLYG